MITVGNEATLEFKFILISIVFHFEEEMRTRDVAFTRERFDRDIFENVLVFAIALFGFDSVV